MVEHAPQRKQDEQYPLLKVDSGGGDTILPQVTPATLVTSGPGWTVSGPAKQSWLLRWPEYLSACWMTIILLGISFLVFYSLGMEAYRKRPVLLLRCNDSKPASNVFYHRIIPRGSSAFIMLYSDYLSHMAYQYPSLHFHVYFLVEDSLQNEYRPRHPKLINTLIPISLSTSHILLDECSKRELAALQKKHNNINVTIMPISKYMATTLLRYKWRNIPLQYLPFYASVSSVWQYGGVGMDLHVFNNIYNNRQYVDRKISAILKQHNDGIKPDEYANALNKIDREEECEFISMFFGLFNTIMNETRTFLSKSFPLSYVVFEKETTDKDALPLKQINKRNKRDLPTVTPESNSTANGTVFIETLNSTNYTFDEKKYEYHTLPDMHVDEDQKNKSVDIQEIKLGKVNKSEPLPTAANKTDNSRLVVFYDLSILSDSYPPNILPLSTNKPKLIENQLKVYPDNRKYLLAMHSEGIFIASSSRVHPFLGHLILAGCNGFPQLSPRFAIHDTIQAQCSGIFRDENYCKNFYLL